MKNYDDSLKTMKILLKKVKKERDNYREVLENIVQSAVCGDSVYVFNSYKKAKELLNRDTDIDKEYIYNKLY